MRFVCPTTSPKRSFGYDAVRKQPGPLDGGYDAIRDSKYTVGRSAGYLSGHTWDDDPTHGMQWGGDPALGGSLYAGLSYPGVPSRAYGCNGAYGCATLSDPYDLQGIQPA